MLTYCEYSQNAMFFPLADPLVGSIATQYLQNREEHDRIARLWTKRYATWCVGDTNFSWAGRSCTPDCCCKREKKLIPICRGIIPPPIPLLGDLVYHISSVCVVISLVEHLVKLWMRKSECWCTVHMYFLKHY